METGTRLEDIFTVSNWKTTEVSNLKPLKRSMKNPESYKGDCSMRKRRLRWATP
ncbi:hypothetical protein QN277_016354 [Acacia crassicarpa]|uniref:Uncharacterized protein n=1 Tax=Acacia crassicarpa TaxID=499986 RepID=A0AAE1MWG7_9FABA|nr:hypothetical protein QN277_016354 [Acacia crassicarpa]